MNTSGPKTPQDDPNTSPTGEVPLINGGPGTHHTEWPEPTGQVGAVTTQLGAVAPVPPDAFALAAGAVSDPETHQSASSPQSPPPKPQGVSAVAPNPEGDSSNVAQPALAADSTHLMPVQTAFVFGGCGGAGATTLVAKLQELGVKAYEPPCSCVAAEMLAERQSDLPIVKVVVVPATVYGAQQAAEITSVYPISIVVAVRTTPLTVPWAAKVHFRAVGARSQIIVLPFVWPWKKGKQSKSSRKYHAVASVIAQKINQLLVQATNLS